METVSPKTGFSLQKELAHIFHRNTKNHTGFSSAQRIPPHSYNTGHKSNAKLKACKRCLWTLTATKVAWPDKENWTLGRI